MECPNGNTDLHTFLKRHSIEDAALSADPHGAAQWANWTFRRLTQPVLSTFRVRQVNTKTYTVDCNDNLRTENGRIIDTLEQITAGSLTVRTPMNLVQ